MTALAVRGPAELAAVEYFTEEQMRLIKSIIAPKATNDELALFAYQCKRTGLDPFSRQIYCIHRNERGVAKMTIQVGIDGFRIIADRTDRYVPGRGTVFEEQAITGKLLRATAFVKKLAKDGTWHEVEATAEWAEYYVAGYMWDAKPRVMLSKCAEALALRKAFPLQLSGIYTAEEMDKSNVEQGATGFPPVLEEMGPAGAVTPDMITGPDALPPPQEPEKAPAGSFLSPDEEEQSALTAEFTEPVPVYDAQTGETIRWEPKITSAQNKLIHSLRTDLGHLLDRRVVVDGKQTTVKDGKYRKALIDCYRKEHTNELSVREANDIIDRLTKMRTAKYKGAGTPPSVRDGVDTRKAEQEPR